MDCNPEKKSIAIVRITIVRNKIPMEFKLKNYHDKSFTISKENSHAKYRYYKVHHSF